MRDFQRTAHHRESHLHPFSVISRVIEQQTTALSTSDSHSNEMETADQSKFKRKLNQKFLSSSFTSFLIRMQVRTSQVCFSSTQNLSAGVCPFFHTRLRTPLSSVVWNKVLELQIVILFIFIFIISVVSSLPTASLQPESLYLVYIKY